MHINFIGTKIEGFKSIEDMDFFWDAKGINRIVAPNGSGKTTLIDALVWGLYGESIKGSTLAQIPTMEQYRTENFKGTRVCISFESEGIEYMVVRHYKYRGLTKGLMGRDTLMLIADGEILHEDRDKADVQQSIIDLLGVDYKTFMSSVVFGQRLKRLIEAGEADKKAIFSHFFDLNFIDDALLKAKQFRDKAQEDKTHFQYDLNRYTASIASLEQLKEQQSEYISLFESNKKQNIERCEAQLAALNLEEPTKPDEVEQVKAPEPISNYAVIEAERTVKNLEVRLKHSEDYFQKHLELVPSNLCDKCGSKISTKEAQAALEIERETLEKDISQDRIDLATAQHSLQCAEEDYIILKEAYDEGVTEYENNKESYLQFIRDQAQYNNEVATYQRNLKIQEATTKELETLKESKLDNLIDYVMEIQKETEALATVEIELAKASEEVEAYDFWVRTGFGASGLRNYVINSMLDAVNQAIDSYAIGLRVTVQMSLEGTNKKFDVRIETLEGVEKPYSELSGGEKARVDIALTFALFDVLAASKTKFNILLLDEAFENLDSDGVQDIFAIIREFSLTTNVFLITFIENIDATLVNNLYLVKENGLTYLEE